MNNPKLFDTGEHQGAECEITLLDLFAALYRPSGPSTPPPQMTHYEWDAVRAYEHARAMLETRERVLREIRDTTV